MIVYTEDPSFAADMMDIAPFRRRTSLTVGMAGGPVHVEGYVRDVQRMTGTPSHGPRWSIDIRNEDGSHAIGEPLNVQSKTYDVCWFDECEKLPAVPSFVEKSRK